MQHSQVLQSIRRVVAETFSRRGASADDIVETILLRDNAYCGRRFTTAQMQAIWFVEENEIKFYSTSGSVEEVRSSASLVGQGESLRRAA